jgi:alkaline phosphatase D
VNTDISKPGGGNQMTELTRRSLMGAAAGTAAALAGCAPKPKSDGAPETVYDGEVAFRHGVAAGDPLSDRLILWTRITPLTGAGHVPVRYEIFRDGEARPTTTGMIDANETRDFCVKIDAGGLEPQTLYRYRFTAYTKSGTVVSNDGIARTAAARGDTEVRLGVVSCSNWHFGLFNAYRALAAEPMLDAVVHLGDYLYEYGLDGYGGDVAAALGRLHDPATEIVSLADYRRRHAQYKTDPDLQAAHAVAAWICTWDDHESANNAAQNGAENHQPEKGEGEWSARKAIALQAYMEWMPIREPAPGEPASAVWRTFRFGDVASLHATETRLTGRSEGLDWSRALAGLSVPAEIFAAAMATMAKVNDPARTMLGQAQESWLTTELAGSTGGGIAWQVLANQVIMARVALPKLQQTLTPAQIAAQKIPQVQQMIGFSQLGLPLNLDAWDGYPAARERLFESVAAANARLVTLAGDTHTAFANTLTDARNVRRGVEFGCTSITSPGTGAYVTDVPDLGEQFAAANSDIAWHDPFGNGYTLISLTRDRVRADFRKVSTVVDAGYDVITEAAFEALAEPGGVSALRRL